MKIYLIIILLSITIIYMLTTIILTLNINMTLFCIEETKVKIFVFGKKNNLQIGNNNN